MILNRDQITDRIRNQNLLVNCNEKNIDNCGYTLTIGEIIVPDKGEKYFLSNDKKYEPLSYSVAPAETVIVITKESLRMPNDLMASFWALHMRASSGVLLINGSIVEPKYSGPLSCYLVNFSKETLVLQRGHEIGKLCFHELLPQNNFTPLDKSQLDYEKEVSMKAIRFPASFIGISKIKEEAEKAARSTVWSAIGWGTGIISFLLVFATLHPLLNSWIWQRTGYDKVLEAQKKLDDSLLKDAAPLQALINRVEALEKNSKTSTNTEPAAKP